MFFFTSCIQIDIMRRSILPLLICLLLQACAPMRKADLCIQNATVFLPNGDTLSHQSILIDADTIMEIVASSTRIKASKTLDASGRLVTPGFFAIDEHLDDVFGDSIARLTMVQDSFEVYRQQLAAAYLPFGITTVRTSGDAETWLDMALYWLRHPVATAPDYYPSGGSMISPYDSKPYVNHCFLADSAAAVQKMAHYADLGIRNIKLYGNLRYEAFTPAFEEAVRQHLRVSAQVQNATDYDRTLDMGLRNFEQVATLMYDHAVFDFWGDTTFNAIMAAEWGDSLGNLPVGGSRIYPFLEAARFVGKDHPQVERILQKMKEKGAGMVPCLHFFAQWLGKTWFCSSPKAARFDVSAWSPRQLQRCREGYEVLAHTTLKMHAMGIPLRIGTDHKEGGKAVLSELLLLHAAGIPMRDVLLIATRNSAEAIALSQPAGTIATGQKAHLIIFEQNPLVDAQHLLGAKTVIKDGIVVAGSR
jgi:imidazolonepropionase-like amidohydrolase